MAATSARQQHSGGLLDDRVFKSVFFRRVHTAPTPQSSPFIGFPSSPIQEDHDDIASSAADRLLQRESAWTTVTRWLALNSHPQLSSAKLDAALDVLLNDDHSPPLTSSLTAWIADEIRLFCTRSLHHDLDDIWTVSISISEARQVLRASRLLLEEAQSTISRPYDAWNSSRGANATNDTATHKRRLLVKACQAAALDTLHAAVRRTIPMTKLAASLTFVLTDIISTATTASAPSLDDAVHLLRGLRMVGLTDGVGQEALATAVQFAIEAYVEGFEVRVDWLKQETRASQVADWVSQRLQPIIFACLGALTDHPINAHTLHSDVAMWQRMALVSLGKNRLRHLMTYVQLWPQSLGAIMDLREYITSPEAKVHLASTFISQLEDRVCHAGATTAELLTIYVAVIRISKTLDNRSVLLEKVSAPLRSYLRSRDDTVRVIAASFLAELDENNNLMASIRGVKDEVCVEITKEVLRSETQDLKHEDRLDYDDMTWMPDPIDAGPDYKTSKNNDVVSYMLTLFERDIFVKEIQNILGERLLRCEDEEMATEKRLVEMLKGRLGADRFQAAEVMVRDMADSSRIGRHLRNVKTKHTGHSAFTIWEALPGSGQGGITFVELIKRLGAYLPANEELKQRFLDAVKEAAVPGNTVQDSQLLYRNPAFDAARHRARQQAFPVRFEAKILSSFFWPELRDDEFKLPTEVDALRLEYEHEFKRIKARRRLKWMSALGRVTVELELGDDRVVKLAGVKTWVAAVIYAFQAPVLPEGSMEVDDGSDQQQEDAPVSKTTAQLEEELNMDEVLVRNALSFWASKRVLREVEPDTWRVIESLANDDNEAAARAEKHTVVSVVPAAEAAVSALKSQDAVLRDNKGMYEMFIVGMLTNGGAMDAGKMAMMLKMVVPGGFGYGEDEVVWLLQGMEGEGKVARVGDAWSVKK